MNQHLSFYDMEIKKGIIKMDTGHGRFEEYDKNITDSFLKSLANNQKPKTNIYGIFNEGEILDIKSSKFKIEKIHKHGLHLELLPQDGIKK